MSNRNTLDTNLDYTGLNKFFNYLFFTKSNKEYTNNLNNSITNSFFNSKLLNYKTLFSFSDSKSVTKALLPNERSMRFVNGLNLDNKNSVVLPIEHNPVPSVKNFNFDSSFAEQYTPLLLQSKEEAAPNFVFDTY
jgi:hypothetical protein